jgi:hypothetical protein
VENTMTHTLSRPTSQAQKIEEQRRAEQAEKMAAQKADRLQVRADLITATHTLFKDLDEGAQAIAKNLVRLAELGMTQAEIAAEFGRRQPWVSRMLKWAKDGFKDETPFGPDSAAAREVHEAKIAERAVADYSSKNNPPGNAVTDKPVKATGKPEANVVTLRTPKGAAVDTSGFGAKAKEQISAALASNDADPAGSAAARKAAYAEPPAETPKSKSAVHAAAPVKPTEQQRRLAEFKAACRAYVIGMDGPTFAAAVEYLESLAPKEAAA